MFIVQNKLNLLSKLSILLLAITYVLGDSMMPDHVKQTYPDSPKLEEEEPNGLQFIEETPKERIFRLKYEIAQLEHKIFRLQMELDDVEAEMAVNQNDIDLPFIDAPKIPKGALVIISSKQSEGSGFISEMRGKMFLITNIHVLGDSLDASIQTLEGIEIDLPNHVYVSRNRDIAIIPIAWDGPTLSLSEALISDSVEIRDKVTVMGNSDGARVTTRLEGEIEGIGPNELQVSAKFVPGNSGSPIVHNKLGKVIAIASYIRDLGSESKWSKDSEFSEIRRFGYRLDGNIEWQLVELAELYQQSRAYLRYEDRTIAMAHMAYMIEHESKLPIGYQNHDSLGHLFNTINSDFAWDRGLQSLNNRRLLRLFVDGMLTELQSDQQNTLKALKLNFYKQRYLEIENVRNGIFQNLIRFRNAQLD